MCQLSGTTSTEVAILGLNLGAPSVPINPFASSVNTTATINWSAPQITVGPMLLLITSYSVSGTNTTTNTFLAPVTVSGNPPATTATFSSLTVGDSYTFAVTATNVFRTSSASGSNSITITLTPLLITSISPSSGASSTGAVVTISGSNFTNNATVTFGSVA
jgi:hypothetical protein